MAARPCVHEHEHVHVHVLVHDRRGAEREPTFQCRDPIPLTLPSRPDSRDPRPANMVHLLVHYVSVP